MRVVDTRERENHILDLVVRSYIEESRPISSSYLCANFNLPYSSATIRNVMFSLERKGYLSHVHTSSGRVPTKQGFKHYVQQLTDTPATGDESRHTLLRVNAINSYKELFEEALEALSEAAGYTSMVGMWGSQEGLFLRGMRFIFEQPEFEDITRLRNLFYTFEVKIDQIQKLLLSYVDEELKVLIGDEIGFDEITDCSLLVSGLHERDFSFALAVLGPIRMNYMRALESLHSVRADFEEIARRLR